MAATSITYMVGFTSRRDGGRYIERLFSGLASIHNRKNLSAFSVFYRFLGICLVSFGATALAFEKFSSSIVVSRFSVHLETLTLAIHSTTFTFAANLLALFSDNDHFNQSTWVTGPANLHRSKFWISGIPNILPSLHVSLILISFNYVSDK